MRYTIPLIIILLIGLGHRALAEVFTAEATCKLRPPGEPTVTDRDAAHADALRQILMQWLDRQDTTDAKRRMAWVAARKMSLLDLQMLLAQPEQLLKTRQREGYIEVNLRADLNVDLTKAWLEKINTDHPLKKKRIMVIIPESHLQRTFPDPAGETRVYNVMLHEGFLLVDQRQVKAIRDNDMVKRAVKKNASPEDQKELLAIATDWGAEFVLKGEAVSHEVAPDRSLPPNFRQCSARIELQLVQADSGQVIGYVSANGAASGESEFVAGKDAIEVAAYRAINELLNDVLVKEIGASAFESVHVFLSGADFDQKLQFDELLKSIDGVTGKTDTLFQDARAEMTVQTNLTSSELAQAVNKRAKEIGFGLKVIEMTGGRCGFEVVSATPTSAPAQ